MRTVILHPQSTAVLTATNCRSNWRFFSVRRYSTRTSRDLVAATVGGSGHVKLEILPPRESPSASKNLLVLFHGLSLSQTPNPQSITLTTSLLASLLPTTTLVTLNYRLAPRPSQLAFPHPIHDIFTAFDYISSPSFPHNEGHKPRISLCGSQIGGALATSLALTEPNKIHALAVSEPLVDWTGLDEYGSSKRSTSTENAGEKPEALKALLRLRTQLFRTPSAYFDPFASPLLFLRAPGSDTPSTHNHSGSLPMASSGPAAYGPYDDDYDATTAPAPEPYETQPIKRRKVLRRWPVNGRPEDSLLPHTRVFVRDRPGDSRNSTAGILRAQGEELVELMRRACFAGRERGFGESRVQLERVDGAGSADNEELGDHPGVREAAAWLREMFELD